ncbi:MAG: response regulator, partial [Chloroflexi bacterium]|nr:response regulator [Chloroflexota bacterium]
MQQVHILLADNNKDFLNTRAEFLEHVGYKVFRAYSPAEAELLLMTARIHVAILDIRLTNDEDERDTSGLTLAKKRLYQAVPKIILTGYPSYQYVRDVLGRAVDELPAAVDFLAKSEGPEAMITAVQKTVTKHLGINWDLQIEWGKYVSVEQLMRLILPGLDRADWLMRAAELEDLFRKLFAQFDQLLVDRLLSQVDGRVILSLIGFFADGRESQFIVSCGVSGIVLDEEERFKTAVPEQSKVNLRRWNSAQTVHFACLAFSFHGGDLEESYQLEKLFKQGGEQVLTVVDRTYQQLARWYDRGRYQNTAVSLDTYYRNRFALSAEIDLRTLDEKVIDLCEKGVSSNVATMQTAGSHLVVTLNAQTERHLLHPISWLRGATLSARTGLIWGIT